MIKLFFIFYISMLFTYNVSVNARPFTTDTDSLSADSVETSYMIYDGEGSNGRSKIKIVKRDYNYKEQVGVALSMMLFLAVIFTTTQSLNPE